MTKFYMRWHFNSTSIPPDPVERGKLLLSMLETVRADLQSGALTDWGLIDDSSGRCSDSSEGYIVAETDEASLRVTIQKWTPYVIFEIRPVFTVDQTIESMKLQQQR
jgi:hypothetical protein